MRREHLAWAIAIGGLLLIGFVIGRSTGTSQPTASDTIRAWLWEHRGLDLLTQVGLILVGALGVAAVLPQHRNDHEKTNERKGE